MCRNKVGNQILLFAGLCREFLKQGFEFFVAAYPRLHHFGQWADFGVLGGDFEIAADVVRHQFFDVFRRGHRQVIAHPRANGDALNPGQGAGFAVELNQRGVVGVEVFADARIDAGQAAAGRFNFGVFARQAIHIGRGAAKVRNLSGKAVGLVADVAYLFQNRLLRPALDNPSLVLGNRTEGAAAKTAAHDIHRKPNHVPRRKPCASIGGMRVAGIGQVIDVVHFCGAERDGWGIQPDIAFAVLLHHRPCIARVGF